jgi:hypothetical protein
MTHRVLCLLLALGVATASRPAGGFVLREQRLGRAPEQWVTGQNPTEVRIDLSGAWQYRTAKEEEWHTGWIPSCFDDYQGEVLFRREVTLPDSLRGWHFHLVVAQANYKVSVVINGKFIESAEGNHLGFTLDLPSQLLTFTKANTIELKVDNRLRSKTTLPLYPQIYAPRNSGGILSDCYLWVTPPWSIEGAVLHWPAADSALGATVTVDIARAIGPAVSFLVPGDSIVCSAEIFDANARLVAESYPVAIPVDGPKSQQLSLEFEPFRPLAWSPANPVLYDLDVCLNTPNGLLHLYRQKIGFKRFSVSDSGLLLNGLPISLRGTQYIPESAATGSVIPDTLFEADVRRMKELGFNLLHVVPSPAPPALLAVCDRLGMLVFSGLPLDGIPADILAKPAYQARCELALRRLVRRDRGHACIAAWGLGHDLDWRRHRTQATITDLARELAAMDNRPTFVETYSLNSVADYPVSFFLLGLAPWRRDLPLKPDTLTKPVILSRVGRMVSEGGKVSASEQADFLLDQLSQVSGNSPYAGLLIFSYSDYRGYIPPLAQSNKADPYVYSFGLVDLARHERVSFFKLRDLAQTGESAPMSERPQGESPPVEFPVGSLGLIVLLSLELRRNNVFKQNLKRVFLHAHGFFSDIHARRFLQPSQTVVLALSHALTLALLGSSLLYGLRYSYSFDYLLTHFIRWPGMKLGLLNLVWNPILSIIYLAILFLLLLFLQAVVIKLAGLIFRARVSLGKAVTYVTWSAANFVFLLPFAVVFYRLVRLPALAVPCTLLLLAFALWHLLRMFNALRIAYVTSYGRLYLVALGGGAVVVFLILLLLQASIGTVSFWIYYSDVLPH